MRSKKLFFGKELVFGEILALLIALLSDFLKPLGDITFYVFFFSAASVLILIIIFLTKRILRERLSNYFLASITLMILSGSLYLSYDESSYDSGLLAASFPFMGNLQNDLGIIEKEIAEIKESTLRTESLVKSIATDSKENIQQTKELNKTIRSSNENIVNKLDEINDSFIQISKLGGLISNPERPEEFYNNARVYESRGDYLNARRSYNQYFSFKLDYIDPHLRYQTFLKIQEGRAGAREVYNYFFENDKRLIIEFLRIVLYETPTRINLLKDFAEKNPDFSLVYLELSREYSKLRLGVQSLSEKEKELEYLELFIKMNDQGKFLKYFIDKSLASALIDDANERLISLKPLNKNLDKSRVTSNITIHPKSFKVNLGFREGVKKIFYKTHSQSEFQSTGTDDWINQSTGDPSINRWIDLPLTTKTEVILIKYLDINNNMQGPYEIKFNADDVYISDAKKYFSRMKDYWVIFYLAEVKFIVGEQPKMYENIDGRILTVVDLYGSAERYQQIWSEWFDGQTRSSLRLNAFNFHSHACGISEVKIGFNNDVANKIIKLSECNILKPKVSSGKLRKKYEGISEEKYAQCISNSAEPGIPCGEGAATATYSFLELPLDTKYVTIKIKFNDGEEMIRRFNKEDHCDTCTPNLN